MPFLMQPSPILLGLRTSTESTLLHTTPVAGTGSLARNQPRPQWGLDPLVAVALQLSQNPATPHTYDMGVGK
ncbi:hypothetical protein PGIGA_G00247510 [Pangasianodon gigas]|uniref:Uncharacterized protein n=1 Tax=Pangasianodon gigas TaxID=30993 RepID=A0ACC5WPV3_PANGG|nr:hypothetical protein [Pangasianodon gigas]